MKMFTIERKNPLLNWSFTTMIYYNNSLKIHVDKAILMMMAVEEMILNQVPRGQDHHHWNQYSYLKVLMEV